MKNDKGTIKSPQSVRSPICEELDYQLEQIGRASEKMSQAQKKVLVDKIEKNPEAFLKSSSAKGFKI